MLVFHAAVVGKGTKPLRLASLPRLIPPQVGTLPGTVTVTTNVASLVASCVEVAVMSAVSAPVFGGVKVTPVPEATLVEVLKVPPPVGLTDRFTVFVKAPVPVTVGVQAAV